MFHITYVRVGTDGLYNDQKGSRIRQSLDIIGFGKYHFSKCAQIYDINVVDACDRGGWGKDNEIPLTQRI